MVVDPATLARRRQEKIGTLTVQRDALLERLKTAVHTEKWRVQALLVSTERALRWQLSREGLTGQDCGCGRRQNTRPATRAPKAVSSPTV